ncbi:sensor histidine kinase [Planotetraspora kaengkrachanensis]|nr:HAMP domain-containing sensor histidine kinase [Planotetraspora kaengkrachanensis]
MRERCAPRSVRGQITLLATVITVLTLFATGTGIYLMARSGAPRWRAAPARTVVVAGVGNPGPSHGLRRSHRPREQHAGRLRVPAYASRVVVDAGGTLPGLAWPGLLQLIVVIEAAELITLNTWTAWKVAGRLLRPVDAVCAELSVIDFNDLTTRVSEPRNALEITRLCRAVNKVLGRLNTAKEELEETAHRQRQFASDVSHELRSPIAGLRVQLEAAQLDPGRARQPELLGKLLGQVDRLQVIVDDILCLARVRGCPPIDRRRLDLAALIQSEIAQRTDRLPVRLRLTHGTTVIAVPSQISRLFANLLDNARRHSAHLVCVEVRSTPSAVELMVSDDGPGIAEADRERVFHRFTRLDDARRLDRNGTGLGLAIARDIAQAHQGTLSVEESAIGGARFVLRLPRVRPSESGSA